MAAELPEEMPLSPQVLQLGVWGWRGVSVLQGLVLFSLGLLGTPKAQDASAAEAMSPLKAFSAGSAWCHTDAWEEGGSSMLLLIPPRFWVGTSLCQRARHHFRWICSFTKHFSLSSSHLVLLQMSLEKSEKYRSEMQTRLGSQSGKSKVKSTHQV